MTIASKFGKGRRGRPKADESNEQSSISDEANLWWTRDDFVKHAVVRSRTHPPPPLDAEADPRSGRSRDAPHRSFSKMFPTETLYEAAPAAPVGPAPQFEPAEAASTRPRLTPNHPLASALHCLGLDSEATWSDVQHAYRARAKETHPDCSGDDGLAMARLNATYESLRVGRRDGLFGED